MYDMTPFKAQCILSIYKIICIIKIHVSNGSLCKLNMSCSTSSFILTEKLALSIHIYLHEVFFDLKQVYGTPKIMFEIVICEKNALAIPISSKKQTNINFHIYHHHFIPNSMGWIRYKQLPQWQYASFFFFFHNQPISSGLK